MYEEKTFEVILDRMLADVPDTLDKREGAIIWDALAPTAIEHQLLYIDIDTFLAEVFADTASREYLLKRAAERGLTPKEAEPAVWQVQIDPAGMEIPIGTRFNVDEMNLYVSAKIDRGVYYLTCETAGTVGNSLFGQVTPVNYIRGLVSAELTSLVDPGTDEEDTEEFRARYLKYIRRPAASGNIYDYYNWAMEVDGVGAAKVFPLWNGPGTVKVTITDANKRAASELLVNEVHDHIEEVRPIGATVTVDSGVELSINVKAQIKLKTGYVIATVQNDFHDRLDEYLKDNAYDMDYLPISKVGCLLLNTDGVADYSNLLINDGNENIDLTDVQIGVIGRVVLEVAG